MNRVRERRPAWRWVLAYGGSALRLVILNGLRSWRRDLALMLPAMGSITLLLVLGGTFGLVAVAVADAVAGQAANASALSVYLAPDASPADVAALQARLGADPRVATVREVTPEQALQQAQSRPGLGDLADLAGSNPFVGSLEVKVKLVTEVGPVASSVAGDPAVDPQDPTSYDPQAYSGLRQLALLAGGGTLALLLLLGFICYTVCANAVRTLALARRDELSLIRLLGGRRWMVRGPFVMQGLTTGALAGALAGAVVLAAWWLSSHLAAAVYADVLPGVGERVVELVIAAVIMAGLLVGSVSAAFGVRRLTA